MHCPRALAHPRAAPCRPFGWVSLVVLAASQVPPALASHPHAGGRQGKLPVTAFEAFDLETKSWTRYPSVPSRRAFASCAMADSIFFSLGGLQQPGPHNFYSRPHFVNTVEMFDPVQGEAQMGKECCLCSGARSDADSFSPAGAWCKPSRAIRMREKRADFVAGCLGGYVVAMGGLGNADWCGCGGEWALSA